MSIRAPSPGIPRPAGYKWKFRFLRSLVYPRESTAQIYRKNLYVSTFLGRSVGRSVVLADSFVGERTKKTGEQVPVNESVQFRRLDATHVRNSDIARISRKSKLDSPNPTFPPRSGRLNRDNPSERSEHASPVSGIITLFRSKPRYRSLAPSLARSLHVPRAIPLRSLSIDCFPLVRSS